MVGAGAAGLLVILLVVAVLGVFCCVGRVVLNAVLLSGFFGSGLLGGVLTLVVWGAGAALALVVGLATLAVLAGVVGLLVITVFFTSGFVVLGVRGDVVTTVFVGVADAFGADTAATAAVANTAFSVADRPVAGGVDGLDALLVRLLTAVSGTMGSVSAVDAVFIKLPDADGVGAALLGTLLLITLGASVTVVSAAVAVLDTVLFAAVSWVIGSVASGVIGEVGAWVVGVCATGGMVRMSDFALSMA